jgi:hypothetical protein
MLRRLLFAVLLALQIVGCAMSPARVSETTGSWYMKESTPPGDVVSRHLLIGEWHSESTDIHAIKHIEDSTRFANGTYVNHFVELSEAGKITVDQTECGKWGVSGDIYFTITTAIRLGNRTETASPYDASFYDAYRILSLTTAAFVSKHVVTGQVDREIRAPGAAPSLNLKDRTLPPISPCDETSV